MLRSLARVLVVACGGVVALSLLAWSDSSRAEDVVFKQTEGKVVVESDDEVVLEVNTEEAADAETPAKCAACEAGTCTGENCKAKSCDAESCENNSKCAACEAGTCTDENCQVKKCAAGQCKEGECEDAGEAASAAGAAGPNKNDAELATPTHRQTRLVKVNDDGRAQTKLNCFCLATDGRILAGCGTGADDGEIRVFSPEGDYVETWPAPVKVEAVNVRASDGVVFIAGNGHLVKLDDSGALLADKESPHALLSKDQAEKIREQVINQMNQRVEMYQRQAKLYDEQIEKLQEQIETVDTQVTELRADDDDQGDDDDGDADDGDDDEDDDDEDDDEDDDDGPVVARQIKQLERQRKQLDRQQTALARTRDLWQTRIEQLGDKEPTEEEIAQQVESQIARKLGVASISAVDDTVYIACSAAVGYGYSVWTVDDEFEAGKEVVSDLRGCCGQMDVQACESGIYVAENSRGRVVCFSKDGEELRHWGQMAREGVRGFGSCCNPMNVAFGPSDTVYTAESGSGRIKQYSSEGELLQVVGAADLVPGCKKVSIGVSAGGDRVFMLDITRDHIVLMDRIPEGERAEMVAKAAGEAPPQDDDAQAAAESETEKQASSTFSNSLLRVLLNAGR